MLQKKFTYRRFKNFFDFRRVDSEFANIVLSAQVDSQCANIVNTTIVK